MDRGGVKAAAFDLVTASSIDEAVTALAEPGSRILAGGQSLLPLLAQRAVRPTLLVDVNGLDLGEVGVADGRLRLGALVRHHRLERDPVIAAAAPLLAEAAGLVGYPSIRHRGTLGGSLAHADPAAELPTALVALDGSVMAAGPDRRRRINAADLFVGRFATSLAADEILVEVEVPVAGACDRFAFCEWTPRTSDFAVAGVAVALRVAPNDGSVMSARAAVCGVADVPLDVSEAVQPLLGTAGVPSDLLLQTLADRVSHACAGPSDIAQLSGLLTGRSVWRALGRIAPTAPDRSNAARSTAESTAAGCEQRPTTSGRRCPRGEPHRVEMVVNGEPAALEVEPRTTLLDALRHQLGLIGVHAGCEYGSCGACTVLLDGETARSCTLLAAQLAGRGVTTVEALGTPLELHPVMAAFQRNHGLQCGFCSPAMVLASIELLVERPDPSEAEVGIALAGNLCRCTGYAGIVDAVLDAAASDWEPTLPDQPVSIASP